MIQILAFLLKYDKRFKFKSWKAFAGLYFWGLLKNTKHKMILTIPSREDLGISRIYFLGKIFEVDCDNDGKFKLRVTKDLR